MKGKILSVFVVTVLLPFTLCGCQKNIESKQVTQQASQTYISQELKAETEKPASALTFQFVERHGIVESESPIYIMNADTKPSITEGNITITLVDVVQQDRKLTASFTVTDRTEIESIKDAVRPSMEISMTGSGIGEEGLIPEESKYISNPEFFEEYGYTRDFFTAVFELPTTLDREKNLTGYEFRFLNFEQQVEFIMKQAPVYETLDALAASEGSMDTHDGLSVLAVGEVVEEGILVNWYRYSEEKNRIAGISFTPPTSMREGTRPVLSSGEKEYEFKRSSRYIDSFGHFYQLAAGFLGRQLFIVPQGERNGVFSLTIPGITFLSQEESAPVTLQIPKDTNELKEEIPFGEGSVRIHRITKMQEPQLQERVDRNGQTTAIERPAVYIDVSAVSGKKELSLRRLICKSKSGTEYSSWQNQRYDFDENGNLCGFRIFYNEGDSEISLKFSQPGFYWNQPYELKLQLKE